MPDRTWADIRATILQAVRVASRLPAVNPANGSPPGRDNAVRWFEDPARYATEPSITLSLTGAPTGAGARQVRTEVPSTDPGYTDLTVAVSREVTFILSIRCEAIRADRALDALHVAETIRAWLTESMSPEVAQTLDAGGVAVLADRALTPVPGFGVDARVVKVWVLDIECRAEVFLSSTERVTTIDKVPFEADLTDPPINIQVEVP